MKLKSSATLCACVYNNRMQNANDLNRAILVSGGIS